MKVQPSNGCKRLYVFGAIGLVCTYPRAGSNAYFVLYSSIYSPPICHPDAVEREMDETQEEALACSSDEEDEEVKATNDRHVRDSVVEVKKEETIFSKYDICR